MSKSEMRDLAENAAVPKDIKQLRACLACHLVKTAKQFERDGCENCADVDGHDMDQWTTINFTGIAAITQPRASWVSRWLRKQDLKPGCYALEVVGELLEPA
mmetsp:Transcript_46197/g.96695  ORF Transcript_46197/g.96695 Transcript_46197/m.96695 type:complete len:102 (-) Transcript_46197:55-360(-)